MNINSQIDISEMPAEPSRPSRTAMKRDMNRLQEIGKTLIDLPAGKFAKVELPEKLRSAVTEARRLTANGARRRQLQYIGRIMEEFDVTAISRNLKNLDHAAVKPRPLNHPQEGCRLSSHAVNLAQRLLNGDDDTLHTELSSVVHGVDLQHVRQWVRAARKPATLLQGLAVSSSSTETLAKKMQSQAWWQSYKSEKSD